MPRRFAAALAALGLLAACGPRQDRPQEAWTRANTTQAAYDMDAAACRVEAAQRIPAAYAPVAPAPQPTVVNVLPPRSGARYSSGADLVPPPPRDTNASVRMDAWRVCMSQRGYTQIAR